MDIANSEDKKRTSTTRPKTNWLHPRVYAAVIGLVVWFVVWVWSFAGVGVTDYLLFIVSGFFFIAVSLPLILSMADQAKEAGEIMMKSAREVANAAVRRTGETLKRSEAA